MHRLLDDNLTQKGLSLHIGASPGVMSDTPFF